MEHPRTGLSDTQWEWAESAVPDADGALWEGEPHTFARRSEPGMTRKAVASEEGIAVGPYSHGIDAGQFVFLSGQSPIDPETGALVEGGITQQTRRCMDNLLAVLAEAGLSSDDVVKCNIYLTDMADFAEMNEAYAAYFSQPRPARTTVAVAGLPLEARVEIELVAAR